MSIDRVDWITNYLQNKIVRLEDLKDFFTIQNGEHRIKIEEINETQYRYILNSICFELELEKVETPKSSYRVISAYLCIS